MAIAIGRCHELKPPAVRVRHCRLRSFTQLDGPDDAEKDCAVNAGLSPRQRSLSSPCFSTMAAPTEFNEQADKGDMPDVEVVAGRHASGVHALIGEAAAAITSGTRLVPTQNGLCGALLVDGRSGEHVAVVKPVDDESTPASAPVSKHSSYASRDGVREVAAFLLDHDGFAGVAPTALIKISHPALATTMASIQRFVPHDYDAGELGPSRFSVPSVHRIGILDVRLLNIDRHAGNILVKKQSRECTDEHSGSTSTPLELVPIDHGLCLPEQLEDPYFEWLHWPQSSLPFSDAELEYISSLDPCKDAELLRAELPSLNEPAIRILVLCTIFLKRAAAAGLGLSDIGDMMTREFSAIDEEGLSALEALCKQAMESLSSSSSSDDDGNPDEHTSDTQFPVSCADEEEEDYLLEEPAGMHLLVQTTNLDTGWEGKGIAKSVSFSAAELKNCSGGAAAGGRVSFRALSEGEWREFLERFEQLLPAALRARRRTGLRRRLGTSCKF